MGWYDLIATVAQDPTFNYRLAGHVETGPTAFRIRLSGLWLPSRVVRFPGQFRTTLWPTATPFDSAQGGSWALLFLGSLGAEVVKVFPPERIHRQAMGCELANDNATALAEPSINEGPIR